MTALGRSLSFGAKVHFRPDAVVAPRRLSVPSAVLTALAVSDLARNEPEGTRYLPLRRSPSGLDGADLNDCAQKRRSAIQTREHRPRFGARARSN